MNAEAEVAERRYKMKQLVDATGLPRQAIHFYMKEGLVPPGTKTGRNMAYYSDEHLSRLLTIKKLQHEHFLPLKVIKAVLDGRESSYSAEQRGFLSEVRGRLGGAIAAGVPQSAIDADALVQRLGLDVSELDQAIAQGIIAVVVAPDGRRMMNASSAWTFEIFAEIRRIGFTKELGFTVEELAFYEEHMQRLVDAELNLLFRKLRHLPPDDVARLIEGALPHVHTLLVRYHETKVRELFSALL